MPPFLKGVITISNTIENEFLKYAVENGIINLEEVRDVIAMKKRNELLQKHTYEIYQGKDSRWYTYLPDAKSGRVKRSRSTKKELEDVIVSYIKEQEENPSVIELYQEWIGRKLDMGEISIATKNRYDRQFNLCMGDFAYKKVKNITETDIEDFLIEAIYKHRLTTKSFSNLKTIVIGIFKRAKRRKFIDYSISNIIKDLEISRKMFRVDRKNDESLIFNEEEVPILVKYLSEHSDNLKNLGILLLFKTGLRPGELSALKKQDICDNIIHVCRTEILYYDEKGHKIIEVRDFPKTEAGIRDVIIPRDSLWILDKIRELCPNGEYVFEHNGKRIMTSRFSYRFESVCNQVKIPYRSLNKIRKTYGTILIDGGVDESVVISQMGHTDIKTTMMYYYKDRKDLKRKAEIINSVVGL